MLRWKNNTQHTGLGRKLSDTINDKIQCLLKELQLETVVVGVVTEAALVFFMNIKFYGHAYI